MEVSIFREWPCPFHTSLQTRKGTKGSRALAVLTKTSLALSLAEIML